MFGENSRATSYTRLYRLVWTPHRALAPCNSLCKAKRYNVTSLWLIEHILSTHGASGAASLGCPYDMTLKIKLPISCSHGGDLRKNLSRRRKPGSTLPVCLRRVIRNIVTNFLRPQPLKGLMLIKTIPSKIHMWCVDFPCNSLSNAFTAAVTSNSHIFSLLSPDMSSRMPVSTQNPPGLSMSPH